jgi:hypothetical protein
MRSKTIRRNKSRRCNKSRRHNKTKTNKNKGKRRSQKGGLFNISLGLNGNNLLSQTHGKKYYKDGKLEPQICPKIFGFEYCKLDEESKPSQ